QYFLSNLLNELRPTDRFSAATEPTVSWQISKILVAGKIYFSWLVDLPRWIWGLFISIVEIITR
ncbi:MAG: hypothetical protein V2I33_18810, partial [Kangiellaceae bacterium]|nr:hypothetical protein [Kangiellaceae bacterium]